MSFADKALRSAFHDTPVREFHEAFGHPVRFEPHVPPARAELELRIRMLAEELVELANACGVQLQVNSTDPREDHQVSVMSIRVHGDAFPFRYDPVEAADALGDLRYLVDGGNLICGFPGNLVLAEIHRSNMSKLGADGYPVLRADGRIMKGPGYFKPDIRRVLGL